MQLILYVLFLSLALVLIAIGKFSDHIDLTLSGSIFLFVLGLILMIGGLQYAASEETYHVYGDNFTDMEHWQHGTEPNTNTQKDIFLFHINTTTNYANYDSEIVYGLTVNHTFGFLIAILGALLFIFSLFDMKQLPEFRGPQ